MSRSQKPDPDPQAPEPPSPHQLREQQKADEARGHDVEVVLLPVEPRVDRPEW